MVAILDEEWRCRLILKGNYPSNIIVNLTLAVILLDSSALKKLKKFGS